MGDLVSPEQESSTVAAVCLHSAMHPRHPHPLVLLQNPEKQRDDCCGLGH